jgi:hypothetical protein
MTAAALLLLLAFPSALVSQTTTISGTVYDPRTTASALPISNVLVYVTTGTVDALPTGVQCLTYAAPTGVASYTYTAVDGTFTLTNVPTNATYTLVIQAGKWRRQFNEVVVNDPLTGLALHMPANHTQGDIPLIAISTGAVDGLECVLHDMGIADTEFTDDNGTVNAGGRIHLYKGNGSPGAEINASTPVDTMLTGDATTLNGYDVVMFPCQGGPFIQSATAQTNLLNYANAGGRVFATHYSYVWLDPGAPFNSQFPPVANWDLGQAQPFPDPGIANVNTGFTDGGLLSQWLQNAGETYKGMQGQIQVSTLRRDFDSVIPPTQSWLTMSGTETTGAGAVMQMTFNAPVGALAANQCGRVLYTEYHVMNLNTAGKIYPTECTTTPPMSAQEAMLEYALFDLSAFVQPVVVPTLTLSLDPNPLIVKQGDSADLLTVTATNTSSTLTIDSSAILTITLPPHMTATAITDASGGWTCTLSTLTCTRTTTIGSSTSDAVTVTLSVPAYPAGGLTSYTGTATATVSSATFSSNVTATDAVIFQQTPVITWATPAQIIYGTGLSATQLNAQSTVAGTFNYTPAAGTVLSVGQHTLDTTFTPNDAIHYTNATDSVSLTVIPATPVVTVTPSFNPAFLKNSVTFTATFTSIVAEPTGTVIFYDGATPLATVNVSAGMATYSTSALSFGPHSITAAYSGDSTYLSANSVTLAENIEDFSIVVSGSGNMTVNPGVQANYPLIITPMGGGALAGTVSFTVTGTPEQAAVGFSPATVLENAAATTVTLQVTPISLSAAHTPSGLFGSHSLPLALGLLLLPFAGRVRRASSRWLRLAVIAVASAALLAGTTGCGFTYTPQYYSLTVTAASGLLSHTATVKLTVE